MGGSSGLNWRTRFRMSTSSFISSLVSSQLLKCFWAASPWNWCRIVSASSRSWQKSGAVWVSNASSFVSWRSTLSCRWLRLLKDSPAEFLRERRDDRGLVEVKWREDEVQLTEEERVISVKEDELRCLDNDEMCLLPNILYILWLELLGRSNYDSLHCCIKNGEYCTDRSTLYHLYLHMFLLPLSTHHLVHTSFHLMS